MLRTRVAIAVGCVLVSACNCGPDSTVDGGVGDSGIVTFDAGTDAGPLDPGVDAGADAGPPDAGADAGGFDAGGFDAGSFDAGSFDAGSFDAGSFDAGSFDAGGVDAGAFDAGTFDAGPTFAGCPPPTGIVLDAADAGLPSTGLVLWLRPDMGVATLDGGAVCRWEDVSGNGHHFVPGGANLPSRLIFPLGPPAFGPVSFGPNSQLVRNDVLGLSPTQARTVAVLSLVSDTAGRFATFQQGLATTNWKYFGIEQNTFNTVGGREGVYVTANAYDSTRATNGTPRGHVLSISSLAMGTVLPAALVYSVDRSVLTLTRTPGGNGPAGPGNNLVWDFSGANFTAIGASNGPVFGTGVVAEVLVYNRELTGAERDALEDHVAPLDVTPE